MASNETRTKARLLVDQGMRQQMAGELEEAIRLYKTSIRLFPTAEAHTYLGWTYSSLGRLDEAIEQCKVAISLDPDFGNPYNDIGVYLMQQEKLDEAASWLERAKEAKRYGAAHFPYLNLGTLYAAKGMINRALQEFRGALRIKPTSRRALRSIEELERRLQ